MTRAMELLMVSGRLEMKRTLLKILDRLPLSACVAGSVSQAEDALETHNIGVVLCDERIPDGTYHDVLALTADRVPKIPFILLLVSEEVHDSKEAMRLGVAEMIRSPFEPTDIELALIRATGRDQAAAVHAL